MGRAENLIDGFVYVREKIKVNRFSLVFWVGCSSDCLWAAGGFGFLDRFNIRVCVRAKKYRYRKHPSIFLAMGYIFLSAPAPYI